MGKKYKHIYQDICTFENLWVASRKTRRGKRHTIDAVAFEYNLEENLFNTREKLLNEDYQFGEYRKFKITEPKERLIASAPYCDRVVHHALCNVIEPILDRAMIFDSYACRIGKGSHSALDRAQYFLKKYKYTLKYDIKKYFFTIDHKILLQDLEKKITDSKVLILINRVLATYTSEKDYYFNFDGDDLFDTIRPKGLPIGNLTSQLFANYYLTTLDRFLKEQLKIKGYLRYMDDGIIFSKSRTELRDIRDAVTEFCSQKRLKIHENKTQIAPIKNGVRFLGFHLYQSHRRILRENLKRFKKKFRKRCMAYSDGELAWENLLLSINAWLGFIGRNKHQKLINEILSHIKFKHPDTRKGKYSFLV